MSHPDRWRGVAADSGSAEPYVLVTGGAGFIGTNLADRLLRAGSRVLVFDNLSRRGVVENLRWLRATHGDRLSFMAGDVRDRRALEGAVRGASAVFHLAAQVAVTTSLDSPLDDFEVNARGTLNLLEAVRARGEKVPLLFTSTNKVYGALEDVELRASARRYEPVSLELRSSGLGEERPLQFHSPYGCSKGAADQYVLDFARTFGLPAIVFRMSCIYGPHQHGNEDQGWVAHFVRAAMEGRGITLYGDGRQVRDLLYVDDLIEAFLLAHEQIERLAGRAFNLGGGPAHTLSLLELLDLLTELLGERPAIDLAAWRAADQRYYVSNVEKFAEATGWRPAIAPAEGLHRLHRWLIYSQAAARASPSAGLEVSSP